MYQPYSPIPLPPWHLHINLWKRESHAQKQRTALYSVVESEALDHLPQVECETGWSHRLTLPAPASQLAEELVVNLQRCCCPERKTRSLHE